MWSCELFVHLLVSKLTAALVADKYTSSQTSWGTEDCTHQTQIHPHTPNNDDDVGQQMWGWQNYLGQKGQQTSGGTRQPTILFLSWCFMMRGFMMVWGLKVNVLGCRVDIIIRDKWCFLHPQKPYGLTGTGTINQVCQCFIIPYIEMFWSSASERFNITYLCTDCHCEGI